MNTSFERPDLLVSEIQFWNKDNPDSQIGIFITSRKALEGALSRAKDKVWYETINPEGLVMVIRRLWSILEFSIHYTHLEINHMHTYTCIRLNNIGNRCWYSLIMHNLKFILCMIDSLTFFGGVI